MKYWTTQEAAEFLDCTRQHVSLLVRQGKLRAKRFGRVLMVSSASVQAFLFSAARTIGRPIGSYDKQPRKPRPPVLRVKAAASKQHHVGGRANRSVDI
jgi:excisionase family DNA binding protein